MIIGEVGGVEDAHDAIRDGNRGQDGRGSSIRHRTTVYRAHRQGQQQATEVAEIKKSDVRRNCTKNSCKGGGVNGRFYVTSLEHQRSQTLSASKQREDSLQVFFMQPRVKSDLPILRITVVNDQVKGPCKSR